MFLFSVAEIETMLVPIDGPQLIVDDGDGKEKKKENSAPIQTEKHIPLAVT